MAYINSFKGQNWLIPQSINDMIPKNHICFFVEEFVESLDFSGFDMINEGPGHPSYHPRILMKILLQGMLSKERSSRRLASATRENFVFMYLAEKVQPNFRTLCRFRVENAKFIKEIFKETVKLASDHQLVDLSLICIDGTTIKSNTNRKKGLKREQIDKLDSIIDKMIEEDIKQDQIDKEIFSDSEENLTKIDKQNLRGIVSEYRKAKDKNKIKEKINKIKKEFDKDSKLKRASTSDPECRMMLNKKGNKEFSYNAQFSVDSKNQIIVANDVCNEEHDARQLKPQINQVKENINLKKGTKIGVDCGYSNGKNLKFLEDEKLDGYIPNQTQAQRFNGKKETYNQDDYDYDTEKDEIIFLGKRFSYKGEYKLKTGERRLSYYNKELKKKKDVPEFFRERLRMKAKMETEEARKIYNKRQVIVEPPIGNIKQNLGFREFYLRGLNSVKIELNLVSIVHNLKKIWVARGKIFYEEKELVFCLILSENYLSCDTA